MTQALSIRPASAIVPELRVLYWPMYEGSGTTTGATTPSGFAIQTGETGTTRTEALTLQVNAGTVSWPAGAGYSPQGTATAWIERIPSGDAELAFFASLFDLSAYTEGQSILLAFDLTLPAGWTAAQGTSAAMLAWAGDSDTAGWGIETTSAQNIRPHRRPQGAATSGSGSVITTDFALADGRRTFIVQLECTDVGVFRMRLVYSSDNAAPTLGAWFNDEDFAEDGTAAPNLPSGTGLRIGARRVSSTGDRYLRRGAILFPVWIAGSDAPIPDGLVTKALGEMIVWRGVLPRVLRSYRSDNSGDYTLAPDGLADATFTPITLTDMFVNVDGSRDVEDHPRFSLVTEPKALSNLVMPDSPLWDDDGTNRGLLRITDPPGGFKFAQTEATPGTALKPVFLFSTSNVDQSNRNRCEAGWQGNPNAHLPRGERFWLAMRFWHEFDFSDTSDPLQHVAITQLYHRCVNAKLNPCMVASLYADKFTFVTQYSLVDGMTQADQIRKTYTFPGLSADMRGRWVDLVITGVTSWDVADDPWLEVYVDSDLLLRHEGPNIYKGPTWNGLTPVEEIRFGNYPGAIMNTITPRDIYVRRFFVCRNTEGYTLAQIRTALQG